MLIDRDALFALVRERDHHLVQFVLKSSALVVMSLARRNTSDNCFARASSCGAARIGDVQMEGRFDPPHANR
jgi:hypothetical protein